MDQRRVYQILEGYVRVGVRVRLGLAHTLGVSEVYALTNAL